MKIIGFGGIIKSGNKNLEIIMRSILKYLKGYKAECFFAPFFKLLEACFDLFVPLVVTSIIDVGIANGDTRYIYSRIAILVALGIIGLTCAICAQYFAARAAVGTSTALRKVLFSHLGKLSYSQTDNIGTSTMVTRMTSDINQVQTGVNMTLRLFLRSPIIVFGAMIMAFTVNKYAASVFCILIPVLAVIVFAIILAGIPIYKKVQSRLDRVTSLTRENLSGVRVIRAFNLENKQTDDFVSANRIHTNMQKFAGKISGLMNPLTYVAVNIGIIALISISSNQINEGNMTQGELVAVYNYMTQILIELVKLATTIFTVTKAVASANRIQSVLDMPVGREIKENAESNKGDIAIEFDNVSMAYSGGAPALSKISFTAKKGETVGIIGGTGSGKTTLVNLIPAFYCASEGRVNIFGRDALSYSDDELRGLIGIVPQKSVLFAGTVRSNLLWGKYNATDEEMWQALELASAADFVREKGGLDIKVEQKGRNFSGGQRQRLCIARALIRRAPILILDDSSSALDFATDARMRKAISELDYAPTVFIISQRSSSIAHADKILVLDDGILDSVGTHTELLQKSEVYREIYESQFVAHKA